MAIDFEKLNKSIDLGALQNDIEEAAKNGGGDYVEVPAGKYEVSIRKAEIKLSKKGSPMASIWFKVEAGQYKGSIIFYNQVLVQGFGIHNCNQLLRSMDTPDIKVEFKDYQQYNDLLMDIAEANEGVTFALDYGQNSKGYPTFEITEVFED